MASTGYHTVSIAGLDHQAAIISIITQSDLSCLFLGQALLLSQLYKQIDVLLGLLVGSRVNDGCSGYVKSLAVLLYLFRACQNNQVGNSLL